MSIYVLMKDGLFIAHAAAKMRINMSNPFEKPIRLDSHVGFKTTSDINKAQLIEDPDMDVVAKYGLTACEVSIPNKPEIKVIGKTYEQ